MPSIKNKEFFSQRYQTITVDGTLPVSTHGRVIFGTDANPLLVVSPNPFRYDTRIRVKFVPATRVIGGIFNTRGQMVEKITLNSNWERREFIWRAKDQTNGVYLIRLVAQNREYLKKITLLR